MAGVWDELDGSVEMGSGLIAVTGPPGSGKTTTVLEYLADREVHYNSLATAEGSTAKPERGAPRLLMLYWTAKSFFNDALSQIIFSLKQSVIEELSRRASTADASQPSCNLKRRRGDVSSTDLCQAISEWAAVYPDGSELHLVIDDSDLLVEESTALNRWLDGYLLGPISSTCVLLWLISQFPRYLPACYRHHIFYPLPTPAVVEWVKTGRRSERGQGPECITALEPSPLQLYAGKAVDYWRTHLPMSASQMCGDPRNIVQRVHEQVPQLLELLAADAAKSDAAETPVLPQPNSLHFAKLWYQASTSGDPSGVPHVDDLLAESLRGMGFTTVLLAFAAFYCGALPRHHQARILSTGAQASVRRRKSAKAASAAALPTLTSSAFTFSEDQLGQVYHGLLPLCTAGIDALEFASPDWACRHILPRLVSWGLVSRSVSKHNTYHAWISLSTASQLCRTLDINLHQLLPT